MTPRPVPARSADFFSVALQSGSIPAFGCGQQRNLRPRRCSRLIAHDPTTEENPTMKNAIVKTLTAGTAALMLVTATGCSNQEMLTRLDAVEAAAKSAAQDAASAKAAADAAASSASGAANAANSAQSTANQALQAAQASQACCDATNEKIDRAFKRSMGK
ncbi:MAG: hypothetical protein EHM60_09670 [Lysobacterales bacterium]|nr:MAG: hypothetical protein EHM60_09670 [Xanthomonadales bacterium]